MQDRKQAADLSQDSFIRLLNKPLLEEAQHSRSFLALVARGLLIDHFRRSAIERSYLAYLAMQPETETLARAATRRPATAQSH